MEGTYGYRLLRGKNGAAGHVRCHEGGQAVTLRGLAAGTPCAVYGLAAGEAALRARGRADGEGGARFSLPGDGKIFVAVGERVALWEEAGGAEENYFRACQSLTRLRARQATGREQPTTQASGTLPDPQREAEISPQEAAHESEERTAQDLRQEKEQAADETPAPEPEEVEAGEVVDGEAEAGEAFAAVPPSQTEEQAEEESPTTEPEKVEAEEVADGEAEAGEVLATLSSQMNEQATDEPPAPEPEEVEAEEVADGEAEAGEAADEIREALAAASPAQTEELEEYSLRPAGTGAAVDGLPALVWPPDAAELRVYFETLTPIAPFDAPGWRFVRVPSPLRGVPYCAVGYHAQDCRVTQVAYAVPGTPHRAPAALPGYRYQVGRGGVGYWTLWRRVEA